MHVCLTDVHSSLDVYLQDVCSLKKLNNTKIIDHKLCDRSVFHSGFALLCYETQASDEVSKAETSNEMNNTDDIVKWTTQMI